MSERASIGDEVIASHVRSLLVDHLTDVATFDHDVAFAPELPLPITHHITYRRVASDNRDHPVDAVRRK